MISSLSSLAEAALRLLVVAVVLCLVLWGFSVVLTRDEFPPVRMSLEAYRGADAAGEVAWTFWICQTRKLFLDRKPSSLEELRERTEAAREKNQPLAIEIKNRWAEQHVPVEVSGTEVEVNYHDVGVGDLIDRTRRVIRNQSEVPTLRMEMVLEGESLEAEVRWKFAVGPAGRFTCGGQEAPVEMLRTALDAEWRFSVTEGGMIRLGGDSVPLEALREKLERFEEFRAIYPEVGLALKAAATPAAAGGSGDGEKKRWEFRIAPDGGTELREPASAKSGRPAGVEDLLEKIRRAEGRLTVTARSSIEELEGAFRAFDTGRVLKLSRDGELSLAAEGVTLAEMMKRWQEFVRSERITRTEPVTVQEVLEADPMMPTRSKVSFPGRLTYRQAFPHATDEPEHVIREFSDAPLLHERRRQKRLGVDDDLPAPEDLPPVEERLPRNPAVTVGPDDAAFEGDFRSRYGGTLHRVTGLWADYYRKFGTESLTRRDPQGRLQPCLAYRWKVEENNRVFTFWLRKGHRWSDGHPFTAQDILFMTETVIGSPAWSDYPMWMQDRNGAQELYAEDVRDWVKLAQRIRRQADSPDPSPGRQIVRVIEGELEAALGALVEDGTLTSEKKETVQRKMEHLRAGGVRISGLSLEKLREELADPGLEPARVPAVHRHIQRLQLGNMKELLFGISAEQRPNEGTRQDLITKFNKILRSPRFYSEAAWEGIDLRSEREELESRIADLDKMGLWRLHQLRKLHDYLRRRAVEPGDDRYMQARLDEAERYQMNLLLFRAAYRDAVEKAKITRVKIEAIPDEQGDDTHIIRFTFPQPNSIFLERTSHFMFYRGLFGTARHVNKKRHPDGTDRLAPVDVRDWPGLLSTLREQAGAVEPSPGKCIWGLMDEEVRDLIRNAPADSEPPEEDRERIVAELNRLFHRRDFCDNDAWHTPSGAKIDLEGELSDLLTGEGGERRFVSKRTEFRTSEMVRWDELLTRKDLYRRGVGNLDGGALYQFNKMMFRAAYDGMSSEEDETLVAKSRTAALNREAIERGFKSWVDRWRKMGRYWSEDSAHPNTNRPVLQAWRLVTEPNEQTIHLVRNPYYYRVDSRGNQLPYVDMIHDTTVENRENMLLKMRAGKVEMQARKLTFEDFTVLKQHEEDGNYRVRLWANDYCGELQFYVNQSHRNPARQRIFCDPRFHYALSHALNRREMIDVIWKGMGKPRQSSVPKGSKYYSEELAFAGVGYDPQKANRLLDEMGLDRRAADGTRLYRDEQGKLTPLTLAVATTQERPLEAVQMACEYWNDVGLNALMKVKAGQQVRRDGQLGTLDIGVGKEGANFFGPQDPGDFAPVHPAASLQYSRWANWIRSGGLAGVEPPERVKEDNRIWHELITAPSREAQLNAWFKLTDRFVEMLPYLGITTSPGKVCVVKNNFKNVPELALAGWVAHEPGSLCPEVFYFEPED